MASGTSCMIVEHKRDFDLSIVLSAFLRAFQAPTEVHRRLELDSLTTDHHHSSCLVPSNTDYSCMKPEISLDGPATDNSNHQDTQPASTSSAFEEYKNTSLSSGQEDLSVVSAGTTSTTSHSSGVNRLSGNETTTSSSELLGQSVSPTTADYQPLNSTSEHEYEKIIESVCKVDNIELLEHCNILTADYLKAFTELTRFFKLTGPVFSFVARDLSHKITIVQRHLNSPDGEHYRTLSSMIEFELSQGTVCNKGHHASATRTFLRLHWALEFIIEFMSQLLHVSEDTKTSKLVYDIYQSTLAAHHPWWTRKLAYLAVHTLPSIKHLIDIMCKHDYEEVQLLLSDVVAIGRPILRYSMALYEAKNLSIIP